MSELIHVAAAALVDPQGRVLIARRHEDAHQGGLWEFPGGKCEPGESIQSALQRELNEELGIDVIAHRPLIRITHHYVDRSVLLDVHRVDGWTGEPHGREGQPLAWVSPADLASYPMPEADVPIVRALQLPDRYLITPADAPNTAVFLKNLERAIDEGISLVQLRVFGLEQDAHFALHRAVRELCDARGAQLLINGAASLPADTGAAGIHLSSRQLREAHERPDCAGLLAASCHTAEDLQRAQAIGADFAVLSPVLPTRSHPDANPLGWERFSQLVDEVALPVYALGGMQAGLMEVAWASGAQGVAGIRGFWPDEQSSG